MANGLIDFEIKKELTKRAVVKKLKYISSPVSEPIRTSAQTTTG